jgi:uncharacterized protein
MKPAIEHFLQSPALAVVGVSANRRKFGNVVFRELRSRGRTVFPVHRSLETVEGERCYRSVEELPGGVTGVVTVVPPSETEGIVDACVAKGITALWMQQGSESPRAIARAAELGIQTVHGECLLMFLEPVKSIHGVHRWFAKLFGRYPH